MIHTTLTGTGAGELWGACADLPMIMQVSLISGLLQAHNNTGMQMPLAGLHSLLPLLTQSLLCSFMTLLAGPLVPFSALSHFFPSAYQ